MQMEPARIVDGKRILLRSLCCNCDFLENGCGIGLLVSPVVMISCNVHDKAEIKRSTLVNTK
jgi:hypothetical protein